MLVPVRHPSGLTHPLEQLRSPVDKDHWLLAVKISGVAAASALHNYGVQRTVAAPYNSAHRSWSALRGPGR